MSQGVWMDSQKTREAVRSHITNFLSDGDNCNDSLKTVVRKAVDAIKCPRDTDRDACVNLVQTGNFIVYVSDAYDFIKLLGYKNDKFDPDAIWENYKWLVARELEEALK